MSIEQWCAVIGTFFAAVIGTAAGVRWLVNILVDNKVHDNDVAVKLTNGEKRFAAVEAKQDLIGGHVEDLVEKLDFVLASIAPSNGDPRNISDRLDSVKKTGEATAALAAKTADELAAYRSSDLAAAQVHVEDLTHNQPTTETSAP